MPETRNSSTPKLSGALLGLVKQNCRKREGKETRELFGVVATW
jgi:hypothetical protein